MLYIYIYINHMLELRCKKLKIYSFITRNAHAKRCSHVFTTLLCIWRPPILRTFSKQGCINPGRVAAEAISVVWWRVLVWVLGVQLA